MIVLDTNVLSALMRQSADKQVVDWLDKQPPGPHDLGDDPCVYRIRAAQKDATPVNLDGRMAIVFI
jgi:predicted nucleic acid-binding protein